MNKSDKLILDYWKATENGGNTILLATRRQLLKRGKQLHEKQLAMERASIKCDEQE